MKKLALIFLFITSIVNSQNLFVDGDFQAPKSIDNWAAPVDGGDSFGCGSDGTIDTPYPFPNYVQNGSFPGYSCTTAFARVAAWDNVVNHNGWANPFYTGLTTIGDPMTSPVMGVCPAGVLINRCNRFGTIDDVCPPAAAAGITADANHFIGLRMYLEPSPSFPAMKNMRGYATAKLSQPLVAGEVYNLSFYMKLANYSKYTTKGIQWKFSNTPLSIPPVNPFSIAAQKTLGSGPNNMGGANDPNGGDDNLRVVDADGWKLVTATYTATGGEEYFTIGNFKRDTQIGFDINLDAVKTPNGNYYGKNAYYFFDNFSLVAGPQVTSLTSNTPICDGDDAVFTIEGTLDATVTYTVDGGATTQTVVLSTVTSNPAIGSATVTVATTSATDVTITLSDITLNGASTSLTNTATVTVNPIPNVVSIVNDGPFCDTGDVKFTITGTPGATVTYSQDGLPDSTILLSPSGGANILFFGVTTNITIALSDVELNGCNASLTDTSTVVINAIPSVTALVNTNNTTPICSGDDVLFSITGTPDATVAYTVDGGATAQTVVLDATTGEAIVAVPTNDASPVTITLSDVALNGCNASLTDTETATVEVCEIPTGFSPNNDGINDTFDVGFVVDNIKIYNRYGNKVYEESNYKDQWTGDDLPVGTYYYVIVKTDGTILEGWVYINREL